MSGTCIVMCVFSSHKNTFFKAWKLSKCFYHWFKQNCITTLNNGVKNWHLLSHIRSSPQSACLCWWGGLGSHWELKSLIKGLEDASHRRLLPWNYLFCQLQVHLGRRTWNTLFLFRSREWPVVNHGSHPGFLENATEKACGWLYLQV